MEISRAVFVMVITLEMPVTSKTSRTDGDRFRATNFPPVAAMRRCAIKRVRMPALEMNGHLVKSTTISRTPVTSRCASSSGAVLVSRLPLMTTVRRSLCVWVVICMSGDATEFAVPGATVTASPCSCSSSSHHHETNPAGTPRRGTPPVAGDEAVMGLRVEPVG